MAGTAEGEEEEEGLLPRDEPEADGGENKGQGVAKGNRFVSLVVGTLTLIITVPQTIVAVMMGASSLLADSLAMWSDIGAYLIALLVFHVLLRHAAPGRPRHTYLQAYDIVGSSAGFLLLITSSIYITIRASRALHDGPASDSEDEIDPRIVMLFASCGAIVDAASITLLLYYSSVRDVLDFTSISTKVGTLTILSVFVHAIADSMRTLAVFVGALISLYLPEERHRTVDSVSALIVGGFMYVGCAWLAYVTTVSLSRLYCRK